MQLNPMRSKRPAIKWHGSKWRLAPWIISHLPLYHQHDLFVEAFGGSAAVTLQKPRSRLEVYNDLDLNIYNYFQVLRDQTQELITAIKYTPYHLKEYALAEMDQNEPSPHLPDLEQARRFYVRSMLSIMGPSVSWRNGFRRQKQVSRGKSGKGAMTSGAISFAKTDHLYIIAERLSGVLYENLPYNTVMGKYNHEDTVMYLDPPYLGSTRSREDHAYQHEMISDEEHLSFLTLCKWYQGMPLISSYDSELYNDTLLTGSNPWTKVTKDARINGPNSRIECLYLSPQLIERTKGNQQ